MADRRTGGHLSHEIRHALLRRNHRQGPGNRGKTPPARPGAAERRPRQRQDHADQGNHQRPGRRQGRRRHQPHFQSGPRVPQSRSGWLSDRARTPCKVYHVDLYRIENFHDLESLGLEDALSEKAIVIIEWPEHFTFRTDWPTVEIRLEHAGGDSRRIAISRSIG